MRLINADALMEMFRHDIDCYDVPPEKTDDKIYVNAKDVLNMIAGQPTAYDVDKVVDLLINESICARADEDPFIMLDRAIEIVKSGMEE